MTLVVIFLSVSVATQTHKCKYRIARAIGKRCSRVALDSQDRDDTSISRQTYSQFSFRFSRFIAHDTPVNFKRSTRGSYTFLCFAHPLPRMHVTIPTPCTKILRLTANITRVAVIIRNPNSIVNSLHTFDARHPCIFLLCLDSLTCNHELPAVHLLRHRCAIVAILGMPVGATVFSIFFFSSAERPCLDLREHFSKMELFFGLWQFTFIGFLSSRRSVIVDCRSCC